MSDAIESILDPFSSGAQKFREIENHHALVLLSQNQQEAAHYQAGLLRLQAEQVTATQQGMVILENLQRENLCHLQDIAQSINKLTDVSFDMLDQMDALTRTVGQGLAEITAELVSANELLSSIDEKLDNPSETRSEEFRRKAREHLSRGGVESGDKRSHLYDVAYDLLMRSVDDPIGKTNPEAWFDIGYLRWKHHRDIEGAKTAFYEAYMLSVPSGERYAEMARHLAYMQYLGDDFESAYNTVSGISNWLAMYDSSRYASKTGRVDESAAALMRSIEQHPLAITMLPLELAEGDLAPAAKQIADGLAVLRESAVNQSHAALSEWSNTLEFIRESGVDIPALATQQEDASRWAGEIEHSDYLELLTIPGRIRSNEVESLDQALFVCDTRIEEEKKEESCVQNEIHSILKQSSVLNAKRRDQNGGSCLGCTSIIIGIAWNWFFVYMNESIYEFLLEKTYLLPEFAPKNMRSYYNIENYIITTSILLSIIIILVLFAVDKGRDTLEIRRLHASIDSELSKLNQDRDRLTTKLQSYQETINQTQNLLDNLKKRRNNIHNQIT